MTVINTNSGILHRRYQWKMLIVGCVLAAIGIFCICTLPENRKPLVSNFKEYHSADGGEFLQGGGRAEKGTPIKPAGKDITGLMLWVFQLAITGIGLYMIFANAVKLMLPNRRKKNKNEIEEGAYYVKEEKMIVYSKTLESLGIMAELNIGDKFTLDPKTDFGRFYKVILVKGKVGYILKASKFSK
jgi:hypothetical protein